MKVVHEKGRDHFRLEIREDSDGFFNAELYSGNTLIRSTADFVGGFQLASEANYYGELWLENAEQMETNFFGEDEDE